MNKKISAWALGVTVVTAGLALWLPWQLDRLHGNRAIHLRGRVLDQDGQGVCGMVIVAKVTRKKRLHVDVPFGATGDLLEAVTTTTRNDGSFRIDSVGTKLVLGLHNIDGYKMPWDVGSYPYHFDFSGSTPDPDPNLPVLYHVRRVDALSTKPAGANPGHH